MTQQSETSPSPMALRGLFISGALILVASITISYLAGVAAIHASSSVTAEQAVVDQLRETLSTLKDAETGQRGYLLTGEQSYMLPYSSAKDRIGEELLTLETLAKDDDLAASDLETYKQLVARKLAELDRTITLRRESGFDAALAVVKSNAGKQIMDDIRALTARLVAVASDALVVNNLRAARLGILRTVIFIITGVVNLAFLYWAYRRISTEVARRQLIANEVHEQKELLSVTLASIGDGVIVTDEKARITFMNAVAEQLTGWRSGEAQGNSCEKIFRIINETTRLLVESPVEKVLRLGAIVGLANHTLLIRKDGTEIPIDDSGAPIRDAQGAIRGTILVFRDFSDYKKSAAALLAAKTEAEAASIAKDNFLATLSHELRTPLTPVAAILSAWELNDQVPKELMFDVQMMRRNVDLEARLIDDLLDLTRIVRGKLSLNPEDADVHELVNAVASMYQPEIHQKKLRLTLQLAARRHFVRADPARLQQVFMNILKNATKFTPEGGAIKVQTRDGASGLVEIIIHDNGIGMTREILSKVFLPFEQGTDETVRRYGGLGLGLTISKALMDAQGGEISADSAGPGLGSTFTVSLPCVNAPECGPAPTRPPQPAVDRSLAILLVEDHTDTARVMSNLLSGWGHKVTVASTITAALEFLSAVPIDLLISDIWLPDGTGIDLIRQIRETSQVPAIALTGFGMEEDVAACKAAGFDAHLTKPITFPKLEMLIQNLTARPGVEMAESKGSDESPFNGDA